MVSKRKRGNMTYPICRKSTKGIIIDKVLDIITMINTGNPFTVQDIANLLDCTYSTGLRYLQAFSIKLPIIEVDEDRHYHHPIKYKLEKGLLF